MFICFLRSMEADKSNQSANSYNILGAQNAYDNSGATPTPFVNSYADSYYYAYMWANQHVPLTFHEKVPKFSIEKNMDSTKICDGNFQLGSYVTKESGGSGNGSSFLKDDRDEALRSGASGSKGSSDEGYDINNDSNPTKKWKSDMILDDGNSAEKMASAQNHNAVLAYRNSASKDLGTLLSEFEANPQLAKLEKDEIKKERKRQSNRESARRSRIRKQKECEELQRAVDMLMMENSSLKNRLMSLSEECMEINDENNSIEEELVKKYGAEALADLLAKKPTGGK